MIENQSEMENRGYVGDAHPSAHMIVMFEPDVVSTDIHAPMNGFSLIEILRRSKEHRF